MERNPTVHRDSDPIDSSTQFERVYEKLHALACRHVRGRGRSPTLQATALVHEVYLRMVRQDAAAFTDREHFLAVAATAMRQILIDRARRRSAAKRGGGWAQISLNGVEAPGRSGAIVDLIVLDDRITRLAALSPRQARVVEMRVFAGMTLDEVASVLAVSTSTVEKDWRQAKAWLRLQLQQEYAA